jgi:hypothetical protein
MRAVKHVRVGEVHGRASTRRWVIAAWLTWPRPRLGGPGPPPGGGGAPQVAGATASPGKYRLGKASAAARRLSRGCLFCTINRFFYYQQVTLVGRGFIPHVTYWSRSQSWAGHTKRSAATLLTPHPLPPGAGPLWLIEPGPLQSPRASSTPLAGGTTPISSGWAGKCASKRKG